MNSSQHVDFSGLRLFLILAGILVGAYFEVTSQTFSMAVCAGSIIALAGSADRSIRKSFFVSSFGSVFLFILGVSILAAHCRTDSITELRPCLLQSGPMILLGAALIYAYFIMRLAIIPLVSELNDIRGWIVGIGPGWLSSWVLSVRISGALPQDIIADLSCYMRGVTVIFLIILGIAILRNRSEPRWIHQIASGIGISVLFITWSGPFQYQEMLELLMRISAISLGIFLVAPVTHNAFSMGRLLLALGLAGYPLFLTHDLRTMLYLTVDGIGVNIGFMVFWLAPLLTLFRGLQWQGIHTENRLVRFTVGTVALGLGILALFISIPGVHSVWFFT